MEEKQPMRLIMTYDVEGAKLQEYYQFVMGEYVPHMQRLGLELIEAWTTMYGDAPNRQLGFVSRDTDTMMTAIEDDTWTSLNENLNEFVTDFDYKVVSYKQGFQF